MLVGEEAINGTASDAGSTLIGNDAANVLTGGAGDDLLIGHGGDDMYVVDGENDQVVEEAGGGSDTVRSTIDTYVLSDQVENLVLDEDAHSYAGYGNDLDNRIVGNSSDNYLDGGAGADTLLGGDGDDEYVIDNISDTVLEAAGEGQDLVTASVDHTLAAHVENLILTGEEALRGTGNELDNSMEGNEADNLLQGMDGDDQLMGFGSNDTLQGGAGHDELDGGEGIDIMAGGEGDDIYYVDAAGDVTQELDGQGDDTVYAMVTHTLGDAVENLFLQGDEAINGTGNALGNVIVGNWADNTLRGLEGDDILEGGEGDDILLGGMGDDIYRVMDSEDQIIELADEGVDTVEAYATVTLAEHVENLILQDDEGGWGGWYNGTGNAQDNVIVGNSGENTLSGLEGNDRLDGRAGNDQLLGGMGDDQLFGGEDQSYDSFYGGQYLFDNADLLDGGTGNDFLDGGSGDDWLYGGEGQDELYGGEDGPLNTSNNDYLDGGAGLDVMRGGTGDDIYIVDGTMELLPIQPPTSPCSFGSGDDEPEPTLRAVADTVIEYAGEGYDTIYSSVSLVLPEHVEAIEFTGTANIDVLGNAEANFILGNAGNNILNGGGGADFMQGGDGDDTFYVDSTGDVVEEYDNEGIDTVRAYIDGYTLGANLENLDLTGGVRTGTGNALDNRIRGNAADNELYGEAGNDKLGGAGGNDQLYGGDGDDAYIFGRGGGQDTVYDWSGNDKVVLIGDLLPADVTLIREGADLVVGINGTEDRLTLVGWLEGESSVHTLQFCGGPAFTPEEILETLDDTLLAFDDRGAVQEDGITVATGNLLENDAYTGTQTLSVAPGVHTGIYGTLTVAADGSYVYVLDNLSALVQSLAHGQVVSEVFTYTVTSETPFNPLAATATLTIDITGDNDTPTATPNAADVREDSTLSAWGNALTDDVDIDQGTTLQVLDTGIREGVYGTLALAADGGYTYTLRNDSAAVQSLAAWDVVTETFAYTATDGLATAQTALTITIAGTNDAPVVGTALLDQSLAAGAAFSYQFDESAFTDIDQGDVLQYAATLADGSALPEWLTFDAVTRTFSGTPVAGTAGTLEVLVHATDLLGASTSQTFTIAVGIDNAPPETAPDCTAVTEDCRLTAVGNVLRNDSDPDGAPLEVDDPGTRQGTYGVLVLEADGSYRYSLDNASAAVQSLGVGEAEKERFLYTASDGTASTTEELTVWVFGKNDTPTLNVPISDRTVRKNTTVSWQLPEGTFSDIDRNDTLTYTATMANGCPLPSWLSFDPKTQTFSGRVPSNATGNIDIKVVASDGHGSNSYASDTFRVSFDSSGSCGHDDHGNCGNSGNDSGHGSHCGHKDRDHKSHCGQQDNDQEHQSCNTHCGSGASQGHSSKHDDKGTTGWDYLDWTDAHNTNPYGQDFDSQYGDAGCEEDFFDHWLAMDRALAACTAREGNCWDDVRQGADTCCLNQAAQGFLGSTQAWGADSLSLSAGASASLRQFKGLTEGMSSLWGGMR